MSDSECNELYKELLEKHIMKKVGDMFKNVFSGTEVRDADIDHASVSENGSSQRPIVRGDIIPNFDPDNRGLTVSAWIQKIEQLGKIHKWSYYEKTCYMQAKLKGSARDWFDRLEEYDKTWDEWKLALQRAFPRCIDYATILEEFVNRKKEIDETMTHYYHSKLSLAHQCRLDNEAIISCIIKGLPLELQANARAYQCSSPDELYSGFIAPMDDYKSPLPSLTKKRRYEETSLRYDVRKPTYSSCFKCGKLGHLARYCRNNAVVCYFCRKPGHKKNECRLNSRQTSSNNNEASTSREIKLIDSEHGNKIYKKRCHINDRDSLAYIDTGSQVNIISRKVVCEMNLPTLSKMNILRGFGGQQISSNLECSFVLKVDNVHLKIEAVVTDATMDDVDLIVGQPVINHQDVSLVVTDGLCKLIPKADELMEFITEVEHPRPVAVLEEDVCISSGSSMQIKVNIENKGEEDVLISNNAYQLGRAYIYIAGGIMSDAESTLEVMNLGDADVSWKKGKVVARGHPCITATTLGKENWVSRFQNNFYCGAIGLEQISVNSNIDLESQNKLLQVLNKWSCAFANSSKELGTIQLGEMKITLENNSKPVCYRPYRLPIAERQIVRKKVDDLLEAGIIRESQSNFASPVVLVRKKNGDFRLCIDYRGLNKITVKEIHPMPNIEEQLSNLSGKMYFTSLDCNQGFHQVPLSEESIPKTAIITQDGLYEYIKMPFGLVNAPIVFQRLINKAIGNLRFGKVMVYLDDLLIPSATIKEGLDMLDEVLSLLDNAGLKLNLKKCSFLQNKIEYLGHKISSEGISPGTAKTEAVEKFKVPTNVHEIRQFLGLAGYFRKFVKNFSVIAFPLIMLTKKKCPWVWGNEQETAFVTLKKLLTNGPILVSFNANFATEVHTDASSTGLGGILMQRQTEGTLKPVAYFSRVTAPADKFYHSYELETLAVVETLKRFRIYLIGIHFKIITDCSAVRYTFEKRDLIPRIARWWLQIQEYDFEVSHKPGVSMKHVDALSRNSITSLQINSIDCSDWFLAIQLQDESLQHIVSQIQNKLNKELENLYVFKRNRLYRKTLEGERLVVPKIARWALVQKYHDNIGHPGFQKCLSLIKERYWFAKMTRFIQKYVSSCIDCAYNKGNYGKQEGRLHPIPKSSVPMETVHIDYVGPFPKSKSGYSYLLTLIDASTKYLVARPTRTLGSAECIKNLREIFGTFLGYPKRIISDNGLSFTSRYFKDFTDNKQIKHIRTAVSTPRANGQIERYHRTLLDAIRACTSEECHWDAKLSDILWGINNSINSSTKFSPYELMFNCKGRLLGDLENIEHFSRDQIQSKRQIVKKRLDRVSNQMKKRFDKKRKAPKAYKKGDLVLWRDGNTTSVGVHKKLDRKYTGPYVIIKAFQGDRYKIGSVKGMRGYKRFSTLVAADSLRPLKCIAKMDSDLSTDEDSDVQIRDTEDLIDLLES